MKTFSKRKPRIDTIRIDFRCGEKRRHPFSRPARFAQI